MMKCLLFCCIWLVVMPAAAVAEMLTLDNGGVSFEAPDGFKPLSRTLVASKYPRAQPPRYVIGNEAATTTIAYDIKPHDIPMDKIDEFREAFTKVLPRMIPGLEWKRNETVMLGGRKWALFEMTSFALDVDIYNIMLFTGYKGQMLLFNFNSTKNEFPTYEAALRQSMRSIQVNAAAEVTD